MLFKKNVYVFTIYSVGDLDPHCFGLMDPDPPISWIQNPDANPLTDVFNGFLVKF